MKSVLDLAQIGQGMYNISRMYKVLRPDLTGCNWDKLVWEKWAAPKHKFIGWIAWHNRLMTRDRLLRFGAPTEASCLLCGDVQEDHEHLFFKCKYSKMIWKEVSNWLDTRIKLVNLASARRAIRRVKKDLCRRVLHMCILACIYQIWMSRNTALWEQKIFCIHTVVKSIKFDIVTRLRNMNTRKIAKENREWIDKLV
uniref:Reverse transcriptase zinc-binding domain-containing protein n=1 Tax=Chenopodium quinoa TaxID=63459 RepID=A0A803MP87_CHEQI